MPRRMAAAGAAPSDLRAAALAAASRRRHRDRHRRRRANASASGCALRIFRVSAVALLKQSGVAGNLAVGLHLGRYSQLARRPAREGLDGRPPRNDLPRQRYNRISISYSGRNDWSALPLGSRPIWHWSRGAADHNLLLLYPGWMQVFADGRTALFVRLRQGPNRSVARRWVSCRPSLQHIFLDPHSFLHLRTRSRSRVRAIELIEAPTAQHRELHVVVRTSAQPWAFDHIRGPRVDVQALQVDPGVVQIDSLHIDEVETARRAAEVLWRIRPSRRRRSGVFETSQPRARDQRYSAARHRRGAPGSRPFGRRRQFHLGLDLRGLPSVRADGARSRRYHRRRVRACRQGAAAADARRLQFDAAYRHHRYPVHCPHIAARSGRDQTPARSGNAWANRALVIRRLWPRAALRSNRRLGTHRHCAGTPAGGPPLRRSGRRRGRRRHQAGIRHRLGVRGQ